MAGGSQKIKSKPLIGFTKFLLRTVILENDPLAGVKGIQGNVPNLARSFANSMEMIGSRTTEAKTGGALSAVGSVVAGLGAFTATTALLPVGLAVGALGVMKYFRASKDMQFVKAFFQCMRLMQQADKVVSKEETRQMEEFIISLGISDSDKDALMQMPPCDVDGLPIGSFSADQKRSILTGCYGMAFCDGIAPPEEEVFGRIGTRLGFASDALKTLKAEVKRNFDDLERSLINIGALVSFCIPNYATQEEKVLEFIASAFPRPKKPEELKPPIADLLQKNRSIEFFLTVPSFFNNVLPGMYILCKGLMMASGADWRTVHEKFAVLANKGHKEEGAFAFKTAVDGVFQTFSKELDRVFQL